MMNEDELLLARIHSAHHAKPRANVIAALSDEYPLQLKSATEAASAGSSLTSKVCTPLGGSSY
jgi:hypothetical protein